MKKLLMILCASLFMVACGSDCDKKTCDKDSKKTCTKKEGECKKDCKKKCCKKEEGKCEKDCKKKCCKKDDAQAQLEIGKENPSLEIAMKATSGKDLTLAEITKENGLLVIFSCNTCPFVVGTKDGLSEGWENRYNDIQNLATKHKVGFALVNSNEGKRNDTDSFDEMVKHAEAYTDINYVLDKNHVIADAYGARTTPHVYLFDKDNKLVYRGAIDDSVDKKSEVKETYLNNAITNLSEGKEINPSVTKNLGCSIKRVKKNDDHSKHDHKH